MICLLTALIVSQSILYRTHKTTNANLLSSSLTILRGME